MPEIRTSGWLPFDTELEEQGWKLMGIDFIDLEALKKERNSCPGDAVPVDKNLLFTRVGLIAYRFQPKSGNEITSLTCVEGEMPKADWVLDIKGKTGSQILRWYGETAKKIADSIRAGEDVFPVFTGEEEL